MAVFSMFRRGGRALAPVAAERGEPAVATIDIANDLDASDLSSRKPSDFPPLSSRVIIRHLPGASRKDATDKARSLAKDLFDSPSNCWFYIQSFGDGFAIEVQDGVCRPYLPSVLESLREHPNASVAVPMVKRFLVVQQVRQNSLTVELLPEGMPAYAGSRIGYRSDVAMTPVVATNIEWLLAGKMVALSGTALLLASMAWYALDPKVVPPAAWRTTSYAQLPVLQQERSLSATGLDYLVRMEFKDGRWTFQRRADPVLAAAGIAPAPAMVAPPSATVPPPPAAGLAAAAPSLPGTVQ